MIYERRGNALYTPNGGVLERPRILPQDRWLVSATDGLHYRVYKRNGWLRRLIMGKRWHVVSGEATFRDEHMAWQWVETECVNRFPGPDDWHGVGYARWMQGQTYQRPPGQEHFPPPGFFSYFTGEPGWVHTFYHDGPPNWNMPAEPAE